MPFSGQESACSLQPLALNTAGRRAGGFTPPAPLLREQRPAPHSRSRLGQSYVVSLTEQANFFPVVDPVAQALAEPVAGRPAAPAARQPKSWRCKACRGSQSQHDPRHSRIVDD
eukprot:188892-Heterocapsa_arctica.AAC.1